MILVISDIHGNADALKAIVKEAYSLNDIKEVLCLGDLFTLGPEPLEVFKLIRKLPNFKCLRGNHEDYLIHRVHHQAEGRIGNFTVGTELYMRVKHSLDRTFAELGADRVNWIEKTVEDKWERKIGGNSHYFCHGTLQSNLKGIFEEDLKEIFKTIKTKYLWAGHIHLQKEWICDNQVFINPGGSGLPFDGVHSAPYALIDEDGVPSLHRANYDWSEVVEKLYDLDDQFAMILARHIQEAKLVRYPFIFDA